MNVSYSYYNENNEDIDCNDQNNDLYNMAVNLNDKNTNGYKQQKPVYNNFRNDKLFKHPGYSTQGDYSNDNDDDVPKRNNNDNNNNNNNEIVKYKCNERKIKRDDESNKHIYDDEHVNFDDDNEHKLDHIKKCCKCKKIFFELLKSRNVKHVFDEKTKPKIYNRSPYKKFQRPKLEYLEKFTNDETKQEIVDDKKNNTFFSKDLLLILLIGIIIILVLDMLISKRRR